MSQAGLQTISSALAWCPPVLLEAEVKSNNTRPPGFLDRHLADDLILQRIVVDPDLTRSLRNAADNMLKLYKDLNPHNPIMIPNKLTPSDTSPLIEFEHQVEEHYNDVIMPYVGMLASSLSRGCYDSKAKSMFSWTTSADTQRGAIADAFLRGNERCANYLTDLVVWEFKRPQLASSGITEIIEQIAASGEFAWCRCASVNGPDASIKEKCTRDQHYTPEGAYNFTRRPRGPDLNMSAMTPAALQALSPSESTGNEPLRFRPIRSHQSETATEKDKAYHILQQLWINAVVSDATYVILSSGNDEFIGWRHRASRTLFLSPKIIPNKSTDEYIKTLVGLHLQALLEIDTREKAICNAFVRRNKVLKCPGTVLDDDLITILENWEVAESDSRAFASNPRVKQDSVQLQERRKNAHSVLSEAGSIILIAPDLECTPSGIRIIRQELPYVWTRYNPIDRSLDVTMGSRSGASTPTQIAPISRQLQGPEPLDSTTSDGGESTQTLAHPSDTEDEEVTTYSQESQETQYCLPLSESKSENWVEDLAPLPTLSDAKQGLDLLQQATYSPPNPNTIEIFCADTISDSLIVERPSIVHRASLRYGDAYVHGAEVRVKIVKIESDNARQLIQELEDEYHSLKETAKLMPQRCHVYGFFQYRHVIPYLIDQESGRQTYRLACNSGQDWGEVPVRYLALLTSPLGTPLQLYTQPLSQEMTEDFMDLLDAQHTIGAFHGEMHTHQLRVLESNQALITGWQSIKPVERTPDVVESLKKQDHARLRRRLDGHAERHEIMRDRREKRQTMAKQLVDHPPKTVRLAKKAGGPKARKGRRRLSD